MSNTLLISEIFPPVNGGSGRWFWELYRRLPRENYVIAAGESARAASFDETHDLRITRLPLYSKSWGLASLTGLRFYWRTLRKLMKMLSEHDVQMVHCGRCLPEGVMGLSLKLLRRTPYLCYVHGEDVETAASSRELSFLVSRVLRHASVLICNSKNTQSILLDAWNVPEDRTRVLHPGIDSTRFIPAPYSTEARKTLGWDDRPVILTVGRLQKRKGHDVLIQALPAIIEYVPKVLYAIVGEGEEKPLLEALAVEHSVQEHVLFMDEVNDKKLIQCYQQCTLFALPNRNVNGDIEGFGMVLAEAQACGKPVVAGNSGGTKEAMIPGKTGAVIDCTYPDSLSSHLINALCHEEELFLTGDLGRKFVVEELDWGTHAKTALKLFKQMENAKI